MQKKKLIPDWSSCCSTVVKHSSHNKEVEGSVPSASFFIVFFLSLLNFLYEQIILKGRADSTLSTISAEVYLWHSQPVRPEAEQARISTERGKTIVFLVYTQRDHPLPAKLCMHTIIGLRLGQAVLLNPNIFLHIQIANLRQLMLNPYVASVLGHYCAMQLTCSLYAYTKNIFSRVTKTTATSQGLNQ